MPHLDAWQYVAITVLSLLLGLTKSAFGISAALITPLLILFVPVKFGIAITAPIGLITDVVALRNHWGKWDGKQALFLVVTSVLGTILGTYVLVVASNAALKWTIAIIAILYGAVTIYREQRRARAQGAPPPPRDLHWSLGALVGFGGGLISAISNSGGILFTIYLLAVGLRKEAYIATLVTVFFVQNLMKTPLYLIAGVLNWRGLLLSLAMVPVGWVGGWLGKRLVGRLSASVHGGLVGAMILAAGVVSLLR